ncbi:MAG: alpha/beta fold hydrolase [Promethearchaeota archaeon]
MCHTGGDNPPLVFLHCITDYGLEWKRVAQEFESKFDILMVDVRGYEQSRTDQMDYSISIMAKDLEKI